MYGTHIFSDIIVSEVLGYEVRAIPGLQEACQGSRHVFTVDLVFSVLNCSRGSNALPTCSEAADVRTRWGT